MKFVKRTLPIIWTARKTNSYCNEKTNEIERYKTEAHNVLRSYNEKGREWATSRRLDCPGVEKTQVYRLHSRGRRKQITLQRKKETSTGLLVYTTDPFCIDMNFQKRSFCFCDRGKLFIFILLYLHIIILLFKLFILMIFTLNLAPLNPPNLTPGGIRIALHTPRFASV